MEQKSKSIIQLSQRSKTLSNFKSLNFSIESQSNFKPCTVKNELNVMRCELMKPVLYGNPVNPVACICDGTSHKKCSPN